MSTRQMFLYLALLILIAVAQSQTSYAASKALLEDVFSLKGGDLRQEVVGKTLFGGNEIQGHLINIKFNEKVYGAALSAKVELKGDGSLARAVLIDIKGNEYLLYEVYALLVDDFEIRVEAACNETKLLNSITPDRLRIELIDASMTVLKVHFRTEPPVEEDRIRSYKEQIKRKQNKEMIDLLNAQIKKKGMRWIAGETATSLKSYSEKKNLFKRKDMLPNLQGYEYYKGGVFELKYNRHKIEHAPSEMVDEFDWRNRHGANDPNSPYYDGDELGTGWATSVKDQGNCGSCWSFATNGTAEITANLYYNQHIDLNLSEQYVMECSDAAYTPGDGCDGGDPKLSLQYLVEYGVPEEECFPYEESNAPACEDTCVDYEEMLQFTGSKVETDTLTQDQLKRMIIERGSVLGEIESWWHDMNLVGFQTDTDGEMIMIFKNSWGLSEGENGFTYAKIALDDFISVQAYLPPVISLNYTDDDIRCLDMDKDGYCFWGIGPKAATCPEYCPDDADCDDSNNDLGPMLDDGSCSEIGSDTDTDTDSDTDVDTDSDSDTDTDTDGDGAGETGDSGCGCDQVGYTYPGRTLLSFLINLQ